MRRTPTVTSPCQPPKPTALYVRLETGKVEAALHELARELTDNKAGSVTIDMTEIRSLDSAGLRALMTAAQAAHTAGVELRCAAVSPAVYKALHLAKLGTLITRVSNPARL